MWLDSHCHLTADRFDDDRDDVLRRAVLAGVDTLVAIGSGYGVQGNAEAIALAEARDEVFATAGIHPHEAAELDDSVRASLRGWLAHPKVVAVGECGLDYYYMNSPREAQLRAFGEQVALARELDLPVTIHVRSDDSTAYDDLLSIWQGEGGGALEGVLHCYTGSLDFARRGVDAGLYVSFSGIVTFKKSHELRDVARGLPLDRLMVETDAPFLAPEGQRGRRNEPAFLPRVGETLAELHELPVDEVARITSANARRLYRLPE
ncbi:MAG: TatD family hydrolase [Deltaproteobacteria bacterium]|nr:TatD family hydrolase [Deltaproteobacteria bacterium]MBW2419193.1 TatD family hydrolase [Deltaproteobacteria bacterium]